MSGLKILDVGCGYLPRGDVNVDLYVKPSIHRSIALNTKQIPNFVLADSQHLPFKNACFDKVLSSHVIEHVDKPMLMLQEMVRVSNRYVLVRCPHRLKITFHGIRYKAHKNKFGNLWFKQAFEMLHCHVIHNDNRTTWLGIPEEIRVKAEKAESEYVCK
jgi:ubiquinone/menaquinone biosynthesis C-methylase UbiE